MSYLHSQHECHADGPVETDRFPITSQAVTPGTRRSGIGDPVDTKATPIQAGFIKLSSSVNQLQSSLERLANKLAPVLMPLGPCKDQNDGTGGLHGSPLAEDLMTITERVASMISLVRSVDERLEL